ncbi:MAG: hypothetical protein ACRD5K_07395 [Candidatus Acidiferrales bacterium]
MDFAYLIFGLRVRSNLPLPGLEPTTKQFGDFEVDLHFGISPTVAETACETSAEPFFESPFQTETGEPVLRAWTIANGGWRRFDYADGTRFWIDANGTEIWSCWIDTSSFEDAVSYVLGPVFAYLLRLRGVTCLHASAAQCWEHTAAFVGPGGAGKSTLATALGMRGHVVLCDDVVALMERNGAFYVMPAYPYLSLWPESVQVLYGGRRDFRAFSENYPKRMLPKTAGDLRFGEEPMLLDAIFLLDERTDSASAPLVDGLEKREALMWLVGNTYSNLLLDEPMRGREFALLGRLVAAVPVRRLHPHADVSRIGSLCELVESELARPKDATPAVA